MTPTRIKGGLATASAFMIWGAFPLYWKLLASVPPLEVTAHRVVWTGLLLSLFLGARGRFSEVMREGRSWQTFWPHALRAILLTVNWLCYIIAISTNRILDASLGYFLVPIINVALGRFVLKERLDTWRWTAVGLAAASVLIMTIELGTFPWIAVGIALSFGFYGLLRKQATVGAVSGLALETLSLLPLAAGYLFFVEARGGGSSFVHASPAITTFLLLGGLITAIPLVLFAYGTRRINLTTVGAFQYLTPTGKFFIGLWVYLEPFNHVEGIAFVCIWIGLALYTWSGLIKRDATPAAAAET